METLPALGLLAQMPSSIDPVRSENPLLFAAKERADALVVAAAIFDVRRRRPLVVITPSVRDGGFDVDARTVAAMVWEFADTVVMETVNAASELNTQVPSWMPTYGGAVRVFAPGADRCDEATRHPLIRAVWQRDREPQHLKIVNWARTVANSRNDHDPEHKLLAMTRKYNAMMEELNDARTKLKDRPTETREPDMPRVYRDDEAQFEHDVFNVWLATTAEGSDRQAWAMRDYILGPKFLGSLEDMKIASRATVMRAVVDVITGRYCEINGREAKLLNPPGSRKKQIRPSDGATAWRCSIASNTPGAPRLMWWECPGDIPELSLVAHHDDFRIV